MGINKFVATTLSVLAIGGAAEGCSTEPVVERGITLTDPTLDRELKCTREQFQNVAFYSELNSHLWADKNCEGFDAEAKRLIEIKDPLAALVETRKSILAEAGVDPLIETWTDPVSTSVTEMYVHIDKDSADRAREEKKIK